MLKRKFFCKVIQYKVSCVYFFRPMDSDYDGHDGEFWQHTHACTHSLGLGRCLLHWGAYNIPSRYFNFEPPSAGTFFTLSKWPSISCSSPNLTVLETLFPIICEWIITSSLNYRKRHIQLNLVSWPQLGTEREGWNRLSFSLKPSSFTLHNNILKKYSHVHWTVEGGRSEMRR